MDAPRQPRQRGLCGAVGGPVPARRRVAVQFGRPEITTNDAFEAGGLIYRVSEPLSAVTMSYEGEVLLLDDPGALRDPGPMFRTAPRARATVEFVASGVSPIHGGEPTAPEHQRLMYYGPEFSRGHFNQHVPSRGRSVVGGGVGDRWIRLARPFLGPPLLAGDLGLSPVPGHVRP